MDRYFILGTDTDAGKTYATCAFLDYLTNLGKRAMALKPVATGCTDKADGLRSEDERNMWPYSKDLEIGLWRFKPPISPHLAAELEGVSISMSSLLSFTDSDKFNDSDVLLIEGAGGLFVPLNHHETWVDFLKQSKIPVILVVGMQLGCINHACLTAHALQSLNIFCMGWVANFLDKNMLFPEEVLQTVCRMLPMPLLATIPYGGRWEVGALENAHASSQHCVYTSIAPEE